jgi:hypothetical protein
MMNAPIQLTFREVLSISTDLAGYLHDQTRRRRIPIQESQASATTGTTTTTVSSTHLNEWEKSYYALPSGTAGATLGD